MKRKLYTRREAIATLTFLGLASSCTPIKVLFAEKESKEHDYDKTIRAFMETIVPGISIDSAELTEIFNDDYYPFAPYRKIFAQDLDRTSNKVYSAEHFYNLNLSERTHIIEDKLKNRGITQQVYLGALWLTQLSVYTGISSPDSACDIIDFKCMDSQTESYADPLSYLGESATINGNPS